MTENVYRMIGARRKSGAPQALGNSSSGTHFIGQSGRAEDGSCISKSEYSQDITRLQLAIKPQSLHRSGSEQGFPEFPLNYPSPMNHLNVTRLLRFPIPQARTPSTSAIDNYSTSATSTSEYTYFSASERPKFFPIAIHRIPSSRYSSYSKGGITQPINQSLLLQYEHLNYPPSELNSGNDITIGPYFTSSYFPRAETQYIDQQYAFGGPIYGESQPDWAGYGETTALFSQNGPTQVCPSVPIDGIQRRRRPRRRNIDRIYLCGWNGCDKGYGTLNHLNTHVCQQSHGAKRLSKEFKQIREEWKHRQVKVNAAMAVEPQGIEPARCTEIGANISGQESHCTGLRP
ncbi:uncharacterized protein RSE6_02292 [Rhynchosporium secalis]|uniref:C2H2-type domain-containing protein n=1 Tax=Rhynchosporium secalis TaxID=38038 RepID=A0A1E1LZW6_RHYSE|nr:uncharacterized protein RSE6_02292 [Rhynchosporium secalis]